MLTLKPFQVDDVKFLTQPNEDFNLPHRLLANPPGAGKTPVAAIAIKTVKAKSVLIICPSSKLVKNAWKRHLIEWAGIPEDQIFIVNSGIDYPASKCPFVIVNYELLQSKLLVKVFLQRWYDVIICDEAHRLKNLKGKTTKVVLSTHPKVPPLIGRGYHKWLLSGTIMPNRPIELYPILKVLTPELIEPYADWEKFGRHFCNGFKEGFGAWNFKGASNIPDLAKRLKPFMRRVSEEEIGLDIDVIESDFYIDDLKIEGSEEDTPLATLRKEIGLAKIPDVAEYIKDQFTANKTKFLVFAYHPEVLQNLGNKLYDHAHVIYGGTTKARRDKVVEAFMKDPKSPVLLAQIGTMGEAVDGLQHVCHNIINVEPDWSCGRWYQAEGRLKRFGQNKPVKVCHVIAKGTLDDRVIATFDRKEKNIDLLYSTPSSGKNFWFDLKQKTEIELCHSVLDVIEENFENIVKNTIKQERKQTMIENHLERIADALEGIQVAAEKQLELTVEAATFYKAERLNAKASVDNIQKVIDKQLKKQEVESEQPTEPANPVKSTSTSGKKVAGKSGKPVPTVKSVNGKKTVSKDDLRDLAASVHTQLGADKASAKKITEVLERNGVSKIDELDDEQHEAVKSMLNALVSDEAEPSEDEVEVEF